MISGVRQRKLLLLLYSWQNVDFSRVELLPRAWSPAADQAGNSERVVYMA